MIEYKRIHSAAKWHQPSTTLTIRLIRLYDLQIRIDGVIQNTNSKQFEESFAKERIWRKLSD